MRPSLALRGSLSGRLGTALATLSIVLVLAPPLARTGVPIAPERLLVVDCLLPAQVRRLGGSMNYLAPRRAVKAIASECEIRGGEYVAYDRANFATSLQVWKPQAEQGDAQAQVYVGEIYEKGLGTTPDYAQAAFWYQKAADQGFARGRADLAYLYEQGLGVPKDPIKALNLYRQSAGISNDELTFASEVTAAKTEAATQIAALTEQLSKSNEQLEAMRQSLEQARSEARAKSEALRGAQRKVEALRSRIEELKRAPAPGNTNQGELERLKSELAASEARIAQQQKDAQAAQLASAARAAELDQRLQSAARQDEQLRAQLGGITIDAEQARAELAAARARIESMNAQIAQLQQQLAAVRAQVAQDEARLKQNAASNDASLQKEVDRLRQTLANSEARLAQEQTLIVLVQGQRESAEKEVERLQAQQTRAEQQQQQQKLDNEALRAQVVSVQQRLLQSQQKLGEANALVADEQSQVEVLRAQLQRRHDLETSQKQGEIQQLMAELAQREAKLIEQQARIAALEAESRAYNEEISRLKNQQVQTVSLRSPDSVPVSNAPPASAPKMSPRELNLSGYYALIIGNDKYESLPSLSSAVNDAHAVEKVLKEHYGFKTRLLVNATRADILTALNDYRQSLRERDSFLIYYAGHGELNERSLLGYWLPVNAKRDDTTEWISDRMVTDQIGLMAARHIMVIADSCYSGAMTRDSGVRLVATSGASAEVKRLTKLALLPSRTVLTSGGDAPVLDGGAGANSIFARALIDALSRNHGVLEGAALYDQVFDPVHRAAARFKVDQSPRYSALADAGHLNGEFLLIPI
ncbi:MAG TPA: caspase family protein [Steroidobacteraceae bacterium]|nr:caspase family protein [Steroidobacteraceae bacterium]